MVKLLEDTAADSPAAEKLLFEQQDTTADSPAAEKVLFEQQQQKAPPSLPVVIPSQLDQIEERLLTLERIVRLYFMDD